MNVIGLAGKAGSGKDTVADILVRDFGYVKVALSDPMKRIFWSLWPDLEFGQLWGPSERRGEPLPWGGTTIRAALQRLGTEWGRGCDEDVWVNLALDAAAALIEGTHDYTPDGGLVPRIRGAYQRLRRPVVGVVIPDIRFRNEISGIRRCGGPIWRVWRPDAKRLEAAEANHVSEALPDDEPGLYDKVILNNDTPHILAARVAAEIGLDGWPI